MPQDHDIKYDASQRRVAQWIMDRTGIGGGDDPVGFLLSSYDLKIAHMEQLRLRVAALEAIVNQSRKTCGRGNCNCVGSHKVKSLVDEYDDHHSV